MDIYNHIIFLHLAFIINYYCGSSLVFDMPKIFMCRTAQVVSFGFCINLDTPEKNVYFIL